MIPSIIYGRRVSAWLLARKLPIYFRDRLYIISLDEVNVRPKTLREHSFPVLTVVKPPYLTTPTWRFL